MDKKKSSLNIFIISGVAILVGILLIKYWPQNFHLSDISAEKVQEYIKGFGSWAMVVYVLLYAVIVLFLLLPLYLPMSLAAGVLFGPLWGTLALFLATTFAATSNFSTARFIGRRWVEKLIGDKGKKWDDKLSQNGFHFIMVLRMIGFPPFGLIDYMCGLSKMKYRDFLLGTAIGSMPWIVPQVLLADRITNFRWNDPVLWGALIAFILMIVITSKVLKKKQEQGEI